MNKKFNLMGFEAFINESKISETKALEEINESINSDMVFLSEEQVELLESLNEFDAEFLNEAFKSGIFKSLIASDKFTSRGRFQNSFQKDFYKKFKVSLNDIQDSDFTIIRNVDKAKTKELLADSDKLCFWLNTSGDFVTQYDRSKGRTSNDIVMAVSRGKNTLAKHFGEAQTSYRTGKEPKAGYLGVSKWEKESYKGIEGSQSDSWKALHQLTDTIYYFSIKELQSKYGTQEMRNKRAMARSGALALEDPKRIKDANQARYKEIISKSIDPQSILEDITGAMNSATEIFKSMFSGMDVTSARDTRFKLPDDSWGRDINDTMSNITRMAYNYSRDYTEFAKLSTQMDMIAKFIEDGVKPTLDKEDYDFYYVANAIESPDKVSDILERLQYRLDDAVLALVPYKAKAKGYLKALNTYK